MKKPAFDELAASIRQAGAIRRGKRRPGRITEFRPVDVKAIRRRLGKSQVGRHKSYVASRAVVGNSHRPLARQTMREVR